VITRSTLGNYAIAVVLTLSLVFAVTGCSKPAQAPQAKHAQAENPQEAELRFSFAGRRPTFSEGATTENIEVVVSAAGSQGRISLIESDWMPDFTVEPHYHKRHSETFYIVSGHVQWTIGGETQVMGPGDAVHIPANTVHCVRVVGGEKVHSLMVQEPGGYEEVAYISESYTPEQRKDPKISAMLRELEDFNPISAVQPAQPKQKGYFSFAGKRTPYPDRNVEKGEVVVSADDSRGSLALIESYWLPNFAVKPHYHKIRSETFYVLSGHAEWTIDGETHVMGPGDAVHIRPNTVHSVRIVGGKKLHSLWFDQPVGIEPKQYASDNLTPEQQKDPKVIERLNRIDDFYPVQEEAGRKRH